MKVTILLLKVFGYIWLTAAMLFILACLAVVYMKRGLPELLEILSPFNVLNWIVTVITLSPGIAALALAERLKRKNVANDRRV